MKEDNGQKLRILIVDNNSAYISCLETALSYMRDCVISTTNSSLNAIAEINMDKYDLVVTDLVLKDVDGLALVKHLKTSGNAVRQPLFAVDSAITNDRIVENVYRCGAIVYCAKPCDPVVVAKEVVEHFDGVSMTSENTVAEKVWDMRCDRLIMEAMYAVGMPAHLVGNLNTRTAVKIVCKSDSSSFFITKDLYKMIAAINGSTPKRVERTIRTAIEATWNSANIENLHKLFGYAVSTDTGRPTNSEFVARIAEMVMLKMEEIDSATMPL